VRYTADGFVEKNMETLSNELRDLGRRSSKMGVSDMYAAGSDFQPQSLRSSIRGLSVGSQFRASLQELVADLEVTEPHYIRCIKPNDHKAVASFNSLDVLKQLRYSGMLEAIRIRREGYAFREEHERFLNRFKVLLNPEDAESNNTGITQLVEALSRRLNVTDADWQIGHSKIFLRQELAEKLERLAKLRVVAAARVLARFGKDVAARQVAAFLVPWIRFRLHVISIHRKHRSAAKIGATYRGLKQQERYRSTLSKVTKLQAIQRGRIAKKSVQLMKDPFCFTDFSECKAKWESEQQRLEKAAASNNFELAAKLEEKV